jgi:hypothetical protein
LANQDKEMGPARLVVVPPLVPPLVEEMKPTFSWQVLEVQAAVG